MTDIDASGPVPDYAIDGQAGPLLLVALAGQFDVFSANPFDP